MKIRILETYRGIDILEYQSQHHSRLSIGYVPPERGKYGAIEGSPAMTVERVRHAIDAYLDKPKEVASPPRQHAGALEVELVKCDCGHSVPRGVVMNASMGTSCPACYDRMSD